MIQSLDAVAQRYSCRPSSLLGILDLHKALDFDIALIRRLDQFVEQEIEEKKRKEVQEGRDRMRSMIMNASNLKRGIHG